MRRVWQMCVRIICIVLACTLLSASCLASEAELLPSLSPAAEAVENTSATAMPSPTAEPAPVDTAAPQESALPTATPQPLPTASIEASQSTQAAPTIEASQTITAAPAQESLVCILRDNTSLYADAEMTAIIATAHIGEVYALIESTDRWVCIDYIDADGQPVRAFVAPADVQPLSGNEPATGETATPEASSQPEPSPEATSQPEPSATPAVGASGSGSFCIVAHTANQLVIAPMEVPYGAGDTILSALEKLNGHSIYDLSTGVISRIDGVEANFSRSDEGGGYDLSRPASEISVMVFSEDSLAPGEGQLELIRAMAACREDAAAFEGEAVAALYQEILAAYLGISDADAAAYAQRLRAAMAGEEKPAGDANAPALVDGWYQLTTGGELKWFADLVNGRLEGMAAETGAKASLACDVSLNGLEWTPIGSEAAPFVGSFDGRGHCVSGLHISVGGDYQALFGYVGAAGSVESLSVSGSVDAGGSYVAGIVAYCAGSLHDLHNRCKVTSSGRYVGGVVGALADAGCSVSDCTNHASIHSSYESGSAYVGGVLGGKAGKLDNCENSGAVSGYSHVGGVAGQASEVVSCRNEGNVQCTRQYGGGVAGQAGSASRCENSGRLTITGVYVNVQARYEANYIGGVAGAADGIASCTNRGSISGRAADNCHFSSVAGVAGKFSSAADCINYGSISVSGSYVAGVAGGNGGGSVQRCANHGTVSNLSSTGEQTGGVASAGKLEECFNTGAVRGYSSVGGVVGGTTNTTVKRCYNLAPVQGDHGVGGVTGVCLSVRSCFNVGEVSLTGVGGGLIAADCSSTSDCYYLDSLNLYSKAGAPLSRSELRLCMQADERFQLNLNQTYHDGYPCLSWEHADTAASAASIRLPEGEKTHLTMLSGGQLPRLPEKALVSAGGVDFLCDAQWTAPEGFDGTAAGDYSFTPAAKLPEGCAVAADTQIDTLTITVLSEDELPLLSSISLEPDTPASYTTPYGTEPSGFPTHALAVIDGAEQRIAIGWLPPQELDLTDTSAEFTYTLQLEEACAVAEGVEMPSLLLRVQPMMLVEDMLFTAKSSAESGAYALEYLGVDIVDGIETFRYRLHIYDSSAVAYLHITANPLYADSTRMDYRFMPLMANPVERSGELSYIKGNTLSGFVASNRAYTGENRLTITAEAQTDAATLRQSYIIDTIVQPTLGKLQVMNGDTANYITPEFDGRWFAYSSQVPAAVESVTLRLTPTLPAGMLEGMSLQLNGEALQSDADGSYSCTLPIQSEETWVDICLSSLTGEGETISSVYQLCLERLQETTLNLRIAPENALFSISNKFTGSVFANPDGSYTLIRSYDYSYTASAYGYVAQSGSFTAEDAQMQLDISLAEAQQNEAIDSEISSEWNGFRGDDSNNAVSDKLTPVSAEDTMLYWANQAGISYGSDAVSSPILVDGYLVCTAKQNIFKIDTVTGEIVQVGDMITKSTFNITPPTYARGMLFVALADGTVQAFNAATLESLWVYTDPLGGQPNSPITYRNGYIYTGFWNGETDDGNWVCLSVTDEDPSRATEAKQATWTYTQNGGFYWAGAYMSDKYMLVGTDDGQTGYTSASSNLLSLDPNTGRLIDCLSQLDADVRCTICYDKATDRCYFTSKGGYFYSVRLSSEGYFDRSSLKRLDLRNGKSIEGMSTSTPVVYNGRAYVGFSGAAQFQAYSGHGIAVIDLASWSIAYTCPTKGYPQTSGLLTTAYENTGLVYIYFFENMSPGSLRIIRDCPGQTQLLSIYDGSPIDQAEILFTPRGAQRQYVLCSPIVDAYGTIYFKNDSGYMMAIGSGIQSLEVTQQPDKLLYEEGETFDGAGLRVTAHLANGCAKDVSAYVSYSAEPIRLGDTDITIYFNHVKYNNIHEYLDRPETAVNLTVLSTADMAALRSVTSQIDALPAPGSITMDCGASLAALRAEYDALDIALKELVSNYESLTRAEEEYDLLSKGETIAAERLDRLIQALSTVTLDSADSLRSAFEAYDALSAPGKALVKNYALLLERQAQYQALLKELDPAAAAAMELISAIGSVTRESGAAILAARAACDALPEASLASLTNLSTLAAAEDAYAALLLAEDASARQVEELIAAIGAVTLDREPAVLRARAAYDALEDGAKQQVANYDKLLLAEQTLASLKQQLAALAEVTAQLDNLLAQLQAVAPNPLQASCENAPQLVPLVHAIQQLILAQSAEDQALLSDYSAMADQYRIAIAAAIHSDAATTVTADGLEWYQQLRVETLASTRDADYAAFNSLVSPRRVLKLYRVTIIDLITGAQVADHAAIPLTWTIPTPGYNESAYSSVGIAFVGAAGSVEYLESSYLNHKQSLRFQSKGDGMIGFVGTKAEMSASGSVESSGSVLDGAQAGSSSGVSSGSAGSMGSIGSTGSASYSPAQSVLLAPFAEAGESGTWSYRSAVLLPALAQRFTDAQAKLYATLSDAVETGGNRFFSYAVTDEEFAEVIEAYRLSNPLAALASFSLVPEEGMVEVEYLLSEDSHLSTVERWRDQISMILRYALVAGDPAQTAAQLYRHISSSLQPAPEGADGMPWQPDSTQPDAALYPSACYALMQNIAAANDAASAYAYLLMQAGLECMLVEQGSVESDASAAAKHAWVVFSVNGQWFHADPEIDIYNSRNPDVEADVLGHFGMDDDRRRATLDGDAGWVMLAPVRTAALAEANQSSLAVPACTGSLSGYAAHDAQQIVEILDEEVKP